MRIWDVFEYNDEADVLECRLRELDGLAYRHVLVEAGHDHRGRPKPLRYAESRERFAPWADRIIHVVADISGQRTPITRLRAQRDAAMPVLAERADERDIVLAADADEIPAPRMLDEMQFAAATVNVCWMTGCVLAVDWLWPAPQPTAVALPWGRVRSLSAARERGDAEQHITGGHHLSWLGGPDAVRRKLASYGHPEIGPGLLAALDAGVYEHGGVPFPQWCAEPLVAADVDESWPRWVYERKCPPSWFRPRAARM